MKTSRSLQALLLALVAVPAFVLAEESNSKITAAFTVPKPEILPALNFENITLGEIVNSLRKLAGANIILAPTLRETKAPDIKLLNVTLGGVMQAISAAMPEVLIKPTVDESGAICWSLAPRPEADRAKPETRIVRIFKASAKGKPVGPQLDELLKNISDAAHKFCQLNAQAQGHPEARPPTIEAHASTGILAVLGTEADVQLVGQVIQALGGEVVPFTSSVAAPVNSLTFKANPGTLGLSGSPDGTTSTLNFGPKSDPGDTFVTAYMAMQVAEKAEQSGDLSQAISKYESAAAMLSQIATTWPTWQPQIVEYRKKRTAEALSRVREGAVRAATAIAPSSATTNAPDSTLHPLENAAVKLEEARKQIEKFREQTGEAAKKLDELQKQHDALKKLPLERDALTQQREVLQKQLDELKKRLEAAEPAKAK